MAIASVLDRTLAARLARLRWAFLVRTFLSDVVVVAAAVAARIAQLLQQNDECIQFPLAGRQQSIAIDVVGENKVWSSEESGRMARGSRA
uniref:Uncharacterized protein n=1 Tax=Plectus sambesii TaxID=2011161 RepID=A0A914W6G7_9BILA